MITVEAIQRHVSTSFGIAFLEMESDRRSRLVARPRQVAMYFARHLTKLSLPSIGRKFGGRDHTTIMAGIRRVETLASDDAEFAARLAAIRAELETEPENV